MTGDERKRINSLFSDEGKIAMDWTGGFTSADVMAGGCCCAAQQEGTLWLWGAGFGQWLHEGCFACSACRQAATLNNNVSRHRREAILCSAFFISSTSLCWTFRLPT
jgi:hypothetical protein